MKTRNLILLVLVAAGLVFLLSDLFSSASEFSTFEHAKEVNGEVHVIGKWVRKDETVRRPEDNYYSFYLQDSTNTVAKVIYRKGTLGDMSQAERMDVVGKWENGEFVASKIHLKCSSKYGNTQMKKTAN